MSNPRFIYDSYRNLLIWREGAALTREQEELFEEIIERMKLLYEVLP
jgi:hypothetical protein